MEWAYLPAFHDLSLAISGIDGNLMEMIMGICRISNKIIRNSNILDNTHTSEPKEMHWIKMKLLTKKIMLKINSIYFIQDPPQLSSAIFLILLFFFLLPSRLMSYVQRNTNSHQSKIAVFFVGFCARGGSIGSFSSGGCFGTNSYSGPQFL